MSTMKKILGSLAAASMVFTGCMAAERPLDSYDTDDLEYQMPVDGYSTLDDINAESGRMTGDIGALEGLDSPASVRGYDDGEYTQIEVLASTNRGAAMHWLDIYGGLNHELLEPGFSATFVSGNYPASANQVHIEALACQGNQAYAWDFDHPAREIDVSVSETADPAVVQVDYTATVPDGGFISNEQISTGSFLVRR